MFLHWKPVQLSKFRCDVIKLFLFVTILQAKFCTSCILLIFLADVFDQTMEHYSSLLITNADFKSENVSLLKHLRTPLICESFDMQAETSSVICWSYVKLESTINSEYLTSGNGVMISRKKIRLMSQGRFYNSCCAPWH